MKPIPTQALTESEIHVQFNMPCADSYTYKTSYAGWGPISTLTLKRIMIHLSEFVTLIVSQRYVTTGRIFTLSTGSTVLHFTATDAPQTERRIRIL
jgi:hypothetical protein